MCVLVSLFLSFLTLLVAGLKILTDTQRVSRCSHTLVTSYAQLTNARQDLNRWLTAPTTTTIFLSHPPPFLLFSTSGITPIYAVKVLRGHFLSLDKDFVCAGNSATFQRPAAIISQGRAPSYLICQCCVILGHSFVTFPHHALVRSAGGISCGGDDRHSPDIVCRHRGRNSSHKSPASRALF